MNNYYYGKAGKGDYTVSDMPQNRFQLFGSVLKVRWSSICGVNLLYMLFWLPTFIWVVLHITLLLSSEALSGDGTAIHAVMALTETLACKPDMLLSALSTFCGLENAPDALIIRNGLLGRDENGELTPLENL